MKRKYSDDLEVITLSSTNSTPTLPTMQAADSDRVYQLRGGIDVSINQTLLEPDFALHVADEYLSDEAEFALWRRFDPDAYCAKVLELALPLLEQQLAKMPAHMQVKLVPGSASIYSPHDYSISNDELRFSIQACANLSDAEMQQLLDDTVRDDWNEEFGSQYRIHEKLSENYSIYDFLQEGDDPS